MSLSMIAEEGSNSPIAMADTGSPPPQRCLDPLQAANLAIMDARVEEVLNRVVKLEEMIPKDLDLRLQSLEVQDRIGSLSTNGPSSQYKQIFSMIESANQRLEDEKSQRNVDVASLKTMLDVLEEKHETLRSDLQLEEVRRRTENEKFQIGLSTLDAVVRAEACISEATSISAGGSRNRVPSGSSADGNDDVSFDWHELIAPEVQQVVDVAELRLRQAMEVLCQETCGSIEKFVRDDLVAMKADLENAMQCSTAQAGASPLVREHPNEILERRLMDIEKKLQCTEAELHTTSAELRSDVQVQRLALDTERLHRIRANETELKGGKHQELEKRLEAVEGVAERWLQNIGGQEDTALQQLKAIESQLFIALSGSNKDKESAIAMREGLKSLCQCLEAERSSCQAQLQKVTDFTSQVGGLVKKAEKSLGVSRDISAPFSVWRLGEKGDKSAGVSRDISTPASIRSETSGSAAGNATCESAVVGTGVDVLVKTVESVKRERQAGLSPQRTALPSPSLGGQKVEDKSVWSETMQALEALRAENMQLREANRQMSEQLATVGGNSGPEVNKLTKTQSTISVGGINVSPQRLTTWGSYIPSSNTAIATCTAPTSISRCRSTSADPCRNGDVPRSVSPFPTRQQPQQPQQPSKAQSVQVQPLQRQSQTQWPNPASPAAVRMLSPGSVGPVQSARCVSPPRTPAHPCTRSSQLTDTQRRSQPMSRIASGGASGLSTPGSVHGRVIGGTNSGRGRAR